MNTVLAVHVDGSHECSADLHSSVIQNETYSKRAFRELRLMKMVDHKNVSNIVHYIILKRVSSLFPNLCGLGP